jgi:hypothetical protein
MAGAIERVGRGVAVVVLLLICVLSAFCSRG